MANKYLISTLLAVIIFSSCSIEKRRYSRGFTIERKHQHARASIKKNASQNYQVQTEPILEIDSTETHIEQTNVIADHAISEKAIEKMQSPTHKNFSTKKLFLENSTPKISFHQHKKQNRQSELSRSENKKTQAVGVVFMFIVALLMVALGWIFFTFLGLLATIIAIPLVIGGIILFIAALIKAII